MSLLQISIVLIVYLFCLRDVHFTSGYTYRVNDKGKPFVYSSWMARAESGTGSMEQPIPSSGRLKRSKGQGSAGNATVARSLSLNLNCSNADVTCVDVRRRNETIDNQTSDGATPPRDDLRIVQLPKGEDRPHSLSLSAPSVNGREKEYVPCKRPGRCQPLNYTTCLGASLSYKQTSLDLVNGSATSQREIQEQLRRWQRALRNVPKCWAVMQILLCAIYMPRCNDSVVDLPSHEICRVTRGPCRIVESTLGWPDFLRCDAEENFPIQCKTEARDLRFNTSGWCQPPLVVTDMVDSWYEGWEGCGLHCHNALFTEKEHDEIHTFISVVGCLCLLCSLFTVLTFFIDWKSANKYPALIILYINVCFFISSIGWLAQFTPGARDDIVCRRDGTLRKSEPTYGENLSCVIVFVMVYYFPMAAAIWFVMLAYSWYMSFKALGKIREAIEAKTAYFHIIAWSLPVILTIAIMALGQVDGDSVSGICFVGHMNWFIRVGFVLIPISISVITGGFFLIRGLIVLVKLKIGSENIISEKASLKIQETIIRLGVFTGVAFLFVFTTFACHLYEYSHQEEWLFSLRQYIICKSNLISGNVGVQKCVLESRPAMALVQIHLLTLFGAGIMMSTWIWTSSTLDSWKRFLRRAFQQPINEPVKLTKHKMIAKAFAKRREINAGQMSFSFQSTHDDPLGMNFELNSIASQEVSSTWKAALPKFITRRGAFMGAGDLGLRRNSSASDFSQRHPSVDSRYARRHSLDSQISFHMSEQERQVYMAHAREQRRQKKKGVKRRGRGIRVVPSMGLARFQQRRRSSDGSQHSDFGHLIPLQLLAMQKVNNIEKESNDIGDKAAPRPGTAFQKPKTGLQLPNLFRRQTGASSSFKRKFGRHNLGFFRGSDSSSNGSPDATRKKTSAQNAADAAVQLPGQVGGEEEPSEGPSCSAMCHVLGNFPLDIAKCSSVPQSPSCSLRPGSFNSKLREDDAKSTMSTDNESLHILGEQLSSSILVRAIHDSQSDLEMRSAIGSGRHSNRTQRPKSQVGESTLNNCFHSGRSTIVDMAMDSDNRDSSSS